jgi:hypothetical protein
VRDYGHAARSCCVAIDLADISLVADGGARPNIRTDVEQLDMRRVGGLASGQIESDDVVRRVRFGVNFFGIAAARTPERLSSLPPLAPAADTCARTTVAPNTWIKCADALNAASASNKATNTSAFWNLCDPTHCNASGCWSLANCGEE